MEVLGQARISAFARRHPNSRKPLQRFLELATAAAWARFDDVKHTFPAADYVARRLIFDVGGNKYRLVASVDFEEQLLVIDTILTHGESDREEF